MRAISCSDGSNERRARQRLVVAVVNRRQRAARPETVVIVGTGQAGAQAAFALRELGFPGRVVLIGEEAQAPYQRPPLSKTFLAGQLSVDRLYLRPVGHYAAHAIELELHVPVEAVDPRAARIVLRGGRRVGYDKLLLATGCRPRTADIPGARGPAVHYLRTLQDALRLRVALTRGRRVAIVGGGYIGLEVAAIASALGAVVTVIEAEEGLLTRVTTPLIGDFFAAEHRRHGVDVMCGTRVTALLGGERLEAVETTRGAIPTDLAVIGVGAVPNAELAHSAGLSCDDGIVVDEYCRTSEPCIFAAGDCTRHPDRWLQDRMRLESVQNAVDQGTTAALNIAGQPTRYAEVPWFWSTQYGYKLQTAGTFAGHDEIVERGDRKAGTFALVYRRRGVVLGVDAVNMPREYMAVRKELSRQLAEHRPGTTHAATPRDVAVHQQAA
jgi:3-phenylpropionate/trans-cinnamate dioxygenase ferredoxin reductase subunit